MTFGCRNKVEEKYTVKCDEISGYRNHFTVKYKTFVYHDMLSPLATVADEAKRKNNALQFATTIRVQTTVVNEAC